MHVHIHTYTSMLAQNPFLTGNKVSLIFKVPIFSIRDFFKKKPELPPLQNNTFQCPLGKEVESVSLFYRQLR